MIKTFLLLIFVVCSTHIFSQTTDENIAEARRLLLDTDTHPELQVTSLLTLIDNTENYGTLALYYNEIANVYGMKLEKPKIANWYFGKAGMAGVKAQLLKQEFEPGRTFIVKQFSIQGFLYRLENQNIKACKCYQRAYGLAESSIGTEDEAYMGQKDLMWYKENCTD